MHSTFRRGETFRRLACLLLAAMLQLTGCRQFNLFSRDPLARIPEATADDPVVEVIGLWEPAEGIGTDGLPCRGFAGQVLLFTARGAAPVRSNGDLRVYVFDDRGTPEEQEKPIHQFDFEKLALQKYLAETHLGAGYHLFIPYTRKGGMRAHCSLRVRLTAPDGRPVYSKMAQVILPGKIDEKPAQPLVHLKTEQQKQPVTVVQAGYEVPADSGLESVQKSRFESIQVEYKPQGTGTGSAENRQRIKSRLSDLIGESNGDDHDRGTGSHPLSATP